MGMVYILFRPPHTVQPQTMARRRLPHLPLQARYQVQTGRTTANGRRRRSTRRAAKATGGTDTATESATAGLGTTRPRRSADTVSTTGGTGAAVQVGGKIWVWASGVVGFERKSRVMRIVHSEIPGLDYGIAAVDNYGSPTMWEFCIQV